MIKPSDAIKDPGLDGFFKYENGKRVPVKPKMDKYDDEWEEFMNKPTTPIKIFYSQPMRDKTEEEIEDKIGSLDNYIYGILRYSDFKAIDINRIEIIDNLHHEGLDADAGRLRHLGASIQLMEDADLIIFDKDWDKAKGCKVEMAIAETYALHKLDAGNVEFPILLSYWFERFLKREKNEN